MEPARDISAIYYVELELLLLKQREENPEAGLGQVRQGLQTGPGWRAITALGPHSSPTRMPQLETEGSQVHVALHRAGGLPDIPGTHVLK